MKIAVISHSYPTTDDPGRSIFIKNEAHLISSDHHPEIHLPSVLSLPFHKAYSRNRNPLEDKLPFHPSVYFSIPRRRLSSITQRSLSSSLLKTVRKQDPDVVHLHALYPIGLAANKLKKAGYPVILTIHGGDWYYNLRHKRLMPRLINSLDHCDKILCVGKKLLQDIAQYEPRIEKKLYHLPHGVDTDLFCPEKNPGSSKKKLGWDFDKTHLLAVGNLFRVKGYDILLRAFSKIKSQKDCRLHIVAPRSDFDAKRETQKLMDTLNLRDRVTFYDQKSPGQLVEFYRASDLLVSSSRKEGFGLVVAEALACGIPVVATRSGGPEEIVTEETGTLVAPEHPGELRTALEEMITSKERYIPENLHQYIAENFSLSSKREKLNAVYREVY
ncbi:glycosyltransferase family 4 protein [Rhodohalobacter sp. SW132]|uniref:glycosyltransferase family 4 protein n=1 Tax=Rhodohalobacter sp. SW132 TaxID=2293433 RepID=UPI001AE088D1|nr:glycosyltransferase family 4 protein [Rhodohalobacter sp. SW132]